MIEVKHLTKNYGRHTAVNDLSFTVEKGQIYGFLGPNGAGKTTTMSIMTGCLAATSGQVTIDGHDIFEEAQEAKKLIGYLPEQPPLYLDRTPKEYLTFVGRAKGVPSAELNGQIDKIMHITQIDSMKDRLIKNLSKGYRQRVGIAQALMGNPEVIILDEPTVGLDPRQIIEIRELIAKLGKDHTVILSSHILSEVQAICQTILIISNGKLVACDTPENLENLFAGTATVTVTADATRSELQKIIEQAQPGADVETLPGNEGHATAKIKAEKPEELCRSLFFAFAQQNKAITQLTTSKASLEDIFIELTAADKAETSAVPPAETPADQPADTQEKEGTSA
ncbi:MAG TPA: ABC transporter ATP-binding protein [Candidatus Limiplasma sp.]|nr:ABC transporter ATP-binding protein [Candidatus Limiplasma sp.]